MDPAPDAPAKVLETISGQAYVDAVSIANKILEDLEKEGDISQVKGRLVSFVDEGLSSPSLDDLALEVAIGSLFCALRSPWPSDISKSDLSKRLKKVLFHREALGGDVLCRFREIAAAIMDISRNRALSLLKGDSRGDFEKADVLLTLTTNIDRFQQHFDVLHGDLVPRHAPAKSIDFQLQQARAARLTGQYIKAVVILEEIYICEEITSEEVNKEAFRLCSKIIMECLRIPQVSPLKPT